MTGRPSRCVGSSLLSLVATASWPTGREAGGLQRAVEPSPGSRIAPADRGPAGCRQPVSATCAGRPPRGAGHQGACLLGDPARAGRFIERELALSRNSADRRRPGSGCHSSGQGRAPGRRTGELRPRPPATAGAVLVRPPVQPQASAAAVTPARLSRTVRHDRVGAADPTSTRGVTASVAFSGSPTSAGRTASARPDPATVEAGRTMAETPSSIAPPTRTCAVARSCG